MFLKNSTDAKGRKIKVTKLHQPAPLFITKSEAENHEKSPRFANRTEGFRMPASYVNFYITNKTIIIPVFNDPIWDKTQLMFCKIVFLIIKLIHFIHVKYY